MLILAISVKDREYLYKANTARAVSKNSAQKICDIVNECKYQLKPGEIWHIYEIDKYNIAFDYATRQEFKIRRGIVSDYGIA